MLTIDLEEEHVAMGVAMALPGVCNAVGGIGGELGACG